MRMGNEQSVSNRNSLNQYAKPKPVQRNTLVNEMLSQRRLQNEHIVEDEKVPKKREMKTKENHPDNRVTKRSAENENKHTKNLAEAGTEVTNRLEDRPTKKPTNDVLVRRKLDEKIPHNSNLKNELKPEAKTINTKVENVQDAQNRNDYVKSDQISKPNLNVYGSEHVDIGTKSNPSKTMLNSQDKELNSWMKMTRDWPSLNEYVKARPNERNTIVNEMLRQRRLQNEPVVKFPDDEEVLKQREMKINTTIRNSQDEELNSWMKRNSVWTSLNQYVKPKPIERNTLVNEMLKQRRLLNEPIVEFPDDEKVPKQQREMKTKETRPENRIAGNSVENENKDTKNQKEVGTEAKSRSTERLYYEDASFTWRNNELNNIGRRRYVDIPNAFSTDHSQTVMRRSYDLKRGKDPRYYKQILPSTKPNSQSWTIKRPTEERYARERPTEKPANYVLVRRKLDEKIPDNSNLKNEQSEAKTIDTKVGNVQDSHNDYVYFDQISKPKLNVSGSEHVDVDTRSNLSKTILNTQDEELNSWMKRSRVWD